MRFEVITMIQWYFMENVVWNAFSMEMMFPLVKRKTFDRVNYLMEIVIFQFSILKTLNKNEFMF